MQLTRLHHAAYNARIATCNLKNGALQTHLSPPAAALQRWRSLHATEHVGRSTRSCTRGSSMSAWAGCCCPTSSSSRCRHVARTEGTPCGVRRNALRRSTNWSYVASCLLRVVASGARGTGSGACPMLRQRAHCGLLPPESAGGPSLSLVFALRNRCVVVALLLSLCTAAYRQLCASARGAA